MKLLLRHGIYTCSVTDVKIFSRWNIPKRRPEAKSGQNQCSGGPLSVCLIGHNLSRSYQNGVCNVLSILFDYPCNRKAGDLCRFWRGSVSLD